MEKLLSKRRCHEIARTFLKKRCEICGAWKRLEAHHINGNWRDNRAENIMTLCKKPCHSIVSKYFELLKAIY